MQLNFKIEYRTSPGECVCLSGNHPLLGSDKTDGVLELSTEDGVYWTTSLTIAAGSALNYSYLIKRNGEVVRREVFHAHGIVLPRTKRKVTLHDSWFDDRLARVFDSLVFTSKIAPHAPSRYKLPAYSHPITFRLKVPRVPKTAGVMLLGNQQILGHWDKNIAPKMTLDAADDYWKVTIPAEELSFPVAYKYALYDLSTSEIVYWEEGENHTLHYQDMAQDEWILRTDEAFRAPSLPMWKGAGLSVPVFSLRTTSDFGVGEFLDLKQLIDFAIQSGLQLIQILPIQDTSLTGLSQDSYPYNALSVMALHPMYLNIPRMGELGDPKLQQAYEREKTRLAKLTVVDYEQVNRLKWKYFRYLYQAEGETVMKTSAFKTFFQRNATWLKPYAVFCYLRDKYRTADFRSWGTSDSVYSEALVHRLTKEGTPSATKIGLYYYVQFHLDAQLREVCQYAASKGIALKGDIPIGISPNSVEAWQTPNLFNTTMSAGAPPDDFSEIGQNWGFPTYNWNAMSADGFQWWKSRFSKMSDYFDAYRIDHILGFFRIWEIPTDAVWGLLGHFNPALPLTKEDINSWGIDFSEERYVSPYITDDLLMSLFGEKAQLVKQTFLSPIAGGRYVFLPDCATQRGCLAYARGHAEEFVSDDILLNNLLQLHTEVLFVADPCVEGAYHPRISSLKSASFQSLDEATQMAFTALYEDFFYHRHNDFWHQQAMTKLPSWVETSNMMVCGEDLGMIPASVPDVMNTLQILSLEVERMPKNYGVEFADLQRIPYGSVCTPATHDMSPIRLWWKEDAIRSERYFYDVLRFNPPMPSDANAEVCEHIVRNHLWSNAMWVILQIQDWMSLYEPLCTMRPEDERINIPSNPRHVWNYRMNVSLEVLLNDRVFSTKIRNLVWSSGRSLSF